MGQPVGPQQPASPLPGGVRRCGGSLNDLPQMAAPGGRLGGGVLPPRNGSHGDLGDLQRMARDAGAAASPSAATTPTSAMTKSERTAALLAKMTAARQRTMSTGW